MLENARRVALSGQTRQIIRVPVIPTFNATVEEIQAIAAFFTGRSNELMLENARRVALSGQTRQIIRVPVIPTFNATVEEIQAIAAFADTLPGVEELHLLPYHRLGQDKYEGLGREYLMEGILPPEPETMNTLKKAAERVSSLHVQIGG